MANKEFIKEGKLKDGLVQRAPKSALSGKAKAAKPLSCSKS